MDKLKFVIEGVDEDNGVVFVKFDNTVRQNIKLPEVPTSEEHLADMLRPLAPTVEQLEIRAAKPDLSLVKSLVGKHIETKRRSIKREKEESASKYAEEREQQTTVRRAESEAAAAAQRLAIESLIDAKLDAKLDSKLTARGLDKAGIESLVDAKVGKSAPSTPKK